MRSHRFGRRAGILLLGLAGLGGCHVPDLLPGNGENPSGLSPPQVADVQVAMGRSLEKRGEEDRAMSAYLDAVKQDPSRADALTRLAVLYDEQGRFASSRTAYEKALAAQPGSPDLYCDMGYSLYLQHHLAEAEMNLRQAIALAPDHRRAHNNLGLVLAHGGREDEALAEFRRAGCTEADARNNLAFALTLNGRTPEARQQYEQALAAEPSSAAAKKAIQELDALADARERLTGKLTLDR